MVDMKDLLIQKLETLGYPIFLQGTLEENEPYPESFFTFKNMSTDGDEFYDNKEHSFIWEFIVAFYSSDPGLVNTKLLEAKTLLKNVGFIVTGKGFDVNSDEPTHTGRGIYVYKIEK